MIASRKDKAPDIKDNFAWLGRYLADAANQGEKLHSLWIANCDAGSTIEDLDDALVEIEALRALKPGIDNKTYHLVISFRPSEVPSEDVLRDIDQAFAKALGYADHQRVVATHENTDNFHMHVAYNKVHPKTLRVHTPHNDFRILERTARAMEKKHGLAVDRGMSDTDKAQSKAAEKARDFEAHHWQQSFHSYMLEHKDEILQMIAEAPDWAAVHEGLEDFGVELAKRGNGMVFREIDGDHAMKASDLDRSCSKAQLEKRFGVFVPAPEREGGRGAPSHASRMGCVKRPRRRYEAKPLTKHPATSKLWTRYLERTRRPSTMLGRAAAGWKTYLLTEAYSDPLALILIMAHREFLDVLFGHGQGASKPAPTRIPSSLRPVLRAWREAGPWATRKNSSLLKEKVLATSGAKVDEDGNLVVPIRDTLGHIQGVRVISSNGARSMSLGDTKLENLALKRDL